MSEINIGESDLDSMSIDDLDSLLSEAEGAPKEVNQAEPEVQEEEAETEQSTEAQEVVEEESEDTEVDQETSVKPEDEDEDAYVEPQYRGKSKAQILDMQRNANRKISQQNNDIHQLKKQIQELKDAQELKEKEVVKKNEDEFLSNYADDDIAAIRKLIQREFQQKEQALQEQTKAEKEAAIRDNEEAWEHLKVFNPELHSRIQDKALKAIKADEANTLNRKGWLKSFIAQENSKLSEEGNKTNTKVVKKKRVATISGGGVSKRASQGLNKSIDDMTADEYLKHMAAKGIKI